LKSGEFVLVDTPWNEGEGWKDATFTFAGSKREETLPEIPDTPPVDTIVGSGPQDSTGAATA
jgi:hypothetical protein